MAHPNPDRWTPRLQDVESGILAQAGDIAALDSHVAGAVPQDLRNLHGDLYQKLLTNGDGSCGIHALFGRPALGYAGLFELKHDHARGLVREYLDRP